MLLTGYSGQAYLGMGDAYLFTSIAAVAIGGASILGGSGHYLGTIAGAFVLTILTGLLPALNLSSGALLIVYGAVILITVSLGSEAFSGIARPCAAAGRDTAAKHREAVRNGRDHLRRRCQGRARRRHATGTRRRACSGGSTSGGPTIHRYDPATGKDETLQAPEYLGCLGLRESGGLVLTMASGFYFFDPETGAVRADRRPGKRHCATRASTTARPTGRAASGRARCSGARQGTGQDGLIVGDLFGRPLREDSVVLALSTACRHPAIALSIATANFPDEHFVGTILLYLLVKPSSGRRVYEVAAAVRSIRRCCVTGGAYAPPSRILSRGSETEEDACTNRRRGQHRCLLRLRAAIQVQQVVRFRDDGEVEGVGGYDCLADAQLGVPVSRCRSEQKGRVAGVGQLNVAAERLHHRDRKAVAAAGDGAGGELHAAGRIENGSRFSSARSVRNSSSSPRCQSVAG